MADIQTQIVRVQRNITLLAERVQLLDLVFNGVIPRDHTETLVNVISGVPLEEDAEVLLTRLSEVSIELHKIAHSIVTVDGEDIRVNDTSEVFVLEVTNAFS